MDTHLHLLSRYHRHGDADAFGVLVREHAGMVFATAKRITGDAGLAEDVAQETFLELARSGQGAVQSVAAWLHRVAWRKACNAIRGESRRKRHEQTAAELRQDMSDAAWAEIEQVIDEVLDELPAAQREPLVQHYLEGRSQQELAARLGVSQSTVSRQLDNAIRELRCRLLARGLSCGTGLAVLLSVHTAEAAPPTLITSLGKLAMSGVGAESGLSASAAITSNLLLMTTTTKVLLAVALVTAVSVPLAFHSSPVKEPARPAFPTKNPKTVALDAPGDAAAPHYRPAPVSVEVSQTVDAILRRHKGLSKEELMRSAELNQLMDRFIGVISAPAIQAEISERIAALPTHGKHGTLTMDIDMLNNATGRAWLEAVVSKNERLMRDWVFNTLDGAIFEFAFDPDLQRTSNGVKLLASPAATKPDE